MVTQVQLKNLNDRVSKLKGYLEIEKKLIEISNDGKKQQIQVFGIIQKMLKY